MLVLIPLPILLTLLTLASTDDLRVPAGGSGFYYAVLRSMLLDELQARKETIEALAISYGASRIRVFNYQLFR